MSFPKLESKVLDEVRELNIVPEGAMSILYQFLDRKGPIDLNAKGFDPSYIDLDIVTGKPLKVLITWYHNGKLHSDTVNPTEMNDEWLKRYRLARMMSLATLILGR